MAIKLGQVGSDRVSGCCGFPEQSDAPFNEDGGFCGDCRDHTSYIDPEDAE